jgi:hypothetical protein
LSEASLARYAPRAVGGIDRGSASAITACVASHISPELSQVSAAHRQCVSANSSLAIDVATLKHQWGIVTALIAQTRAP